MEGKALTGMQLMNRVKDQLAKRGAHTIRGIGRVFRQLDSYDGNKKVDKEEFRWGLKDIGVELTAYESGVLLDFLDTDHDGTVNFDEFLVGVRGELNERRQDICLKAFMKFDKDANGYIDAYDLKGIYNCSFHPKVQSGEMTEDQVFLTFLQSFGDKNKDGKITKKEWLDYYAAVSASIDNDDHFVQLMRTAWKLD